MTFEDMQARFRGSVTIGMPIAGMTVWAALGIAAFFLPDTAIATGALYIMFPILGLSALIERMLGKSLFGGGVDNPLQKLFLLSVVAVALVVPFVVISARAADPGLMVLGMAVLTGIVWIFEGWASGDPTSLRHAIARALGSYAVWQFAPEDIRLSAICGVVVLCYAYSLLAYRASRKAMQLEMSA